MIQGISTPALDCALTFARAESSSSAAALTPPHTDLPFDGRPRMCVVRSDADGCPLQTYHWSRARTSKPRGIIFLLHGVRAHLRLTWLAKRPPHLAERPTPIMTVRSALGAAAGDSSYSDIEDSMSNASDKSLLEETTATSAFSSRPSATVGEKIAAKVLRQAVSARNQRTFADATEEERGCQVFYEGSWIEALNAAGFEVFGMDLRGHGRSGGARCTIEDFELYCADVISVIEQVIWGRNNSFAQGGAPGGAFGGQYSSGVIGPGASEANRLFVVGVSLSTLILCKILQKPAARNLKIHACALFSGFLKEGAKYSTRPIKTFLKLLVKVRHFLPNLPLVLPKKPETHGPSWQLKYGDQDPYLCKRAFTVRMVGTCVAALQEFDDTKDQLVSAGVCKHMKMFHNYYDMVNPVDGSLEVYSWLMEHCKDLDLQCTIYNSIDMDPCQSKLWHPNVEYDSTPLDLGHTLITDTDNLHVFNHFFKWLASI